MPSQPACFQRFEEIFTLLQGIEATHLDHRQQAGGSRLPAAEVVRRRSPDFIGPRGRHGWALLDGPLGGLCCFRLVTMWVTSLGLAGEAGIFASRPFYPMFSGVPNGPLRLSPPQVHAAVHNSGCNNIG